MSILFIALLIFSFNSHSFELTISESLINNISAKHGEFAKRRMIAWNKLMQENKTISESKKLEKVNRFFNQIPFISDIVHWGKEDYWATPMELLATNGGDCEDYSIAKYFTLIALGVSEEKLQIMYVKALRLNQAHMVLTYYPTPNAVPLVLDNLRADILPASKRNDLKPVYSFNAIGLWKRKERGKGKRIGGPKRIELWTKLIKRIKKQEQGKITP